MKSEREKQRRVLMHTDGTETMARLNLSARQEWRRSCREWTRRNGVGRRGWDELGRSTDTHHHHLENLDS